MSAYTGLKASDRRRVRRHKTDEPHVSIATPFMPPPRPMVPAEPFYGLDIFYDPQEKGHETDLDLVLVHGLDGDHIGTWQHASSGTVWPKDLIPEKMPRTRVLSFGYPASVSDVASIGGIRDHAKNLLSFLSDERRGAFAERPLVLVAHSLGGLVVKQALRFACNEERYKAIERATRGILLFSTPHLGTDEEKLLLVARDFAPLVSPSAPSRNPSASTAERRNPLVEALRRDSHDVINISEDFRSLARRYALVSFYETQAWPGTRAPIVGKGSALLNLDHEDQVPLPANHVNICRFYGPADPMFRQVLRRIEDASRGMAHSAGASSGHPLAYNVTAHVIQVMAPGTGNK